jgi:hypothetical protein
MCQRVSDVVTTGPRAEAPPPIEEPGLHCPMFALAVPKYHAFVA